MVLSLALIFASCAPSGDNSVSDRVDSEIDNPIDNDDSEHLDNNGNSDPDESDLDGDETAVVREEIKEGTVVLEGDPHPITLHLFQTPADWSMRFSTYYPEDFVVETGVDDGMQVVRFMTNFAGIKNEEAFLGVYIFPAGSDESTVRQVVEDVASDLGINEATGDTAQPIWAQKYWRGETVDGSHYATISLGQHAGNFFYVITHYPFEMGDGFGPRAHIILEEWLWHDTSEFLTGK